MPKINKSELSIQEMHVRPKFGDELKPLDVVEQLNAIDVQLVHAPTVPQFRETIATFLMNTWNDNIQTVFDPADVDRTIDELFKFELLPTAMETINLTWSVNGMDMIDTTHLIRHRLFSFSAQVHGDRDMRNDRVVAKPGIMANPEIFERYKRLCDDARELYVDILDTDIAHGLDARTVMPRCFEHFYFVRCTIKDLIAYCTMRGDEQIQTTVDNVIAMKLWLEVLKVYPFLKGLVDFNKPDGFYVRQCEKGKTNIFPPNIKNDKFDWCEEQFYHKYGRDEYPGSEVYLKLRKELLSEIEAIEKRHIHE